MSTTRILGILTSGGDCAGLNMAIRAVARSAIDRGWRALGIFDGTLGLIAQPQRYCELDLEHLENFPYRDGGTALGTVNHGDPFHLAMPDGSYRDHSPAFTAGVRALGLDALVVIGGDGSMRILHRLCDQAGIPMIGIPKTIDNDVPGTDVAIGFSTAVQVVSDALDRLQPTAASHHRVMVLEVMGRGAGHIALHGGIAGGADVIVIPELGLDLPGVIEHVRSLLSGLRRHALIVIAEGVDVGSRQASVGQWLAEQIQEKAGVEARCTVLGHLQRGGMPNAQDRLLASAFGPHAVDLLHDRSGGRMVCWSGGELGSVAMSQVIQGPRRVDTRHPLLKIARALGIHVGGVEAAADSAAKSGTG